MVTLLIMDFTYRNTRLYKETLSWYARRYANTL